MLEEYKNGIPLFIGWIITLQILGKNNKKGWIYPIFLPLVTKFSDEEQKGFYYQELMARNLLQFTGKNYQPLIISTPFTKMLVHKMRAENDAILVGKTTEELEQPQLTVREWSGPNPEKLVLTSLPTKEGEYATPAEILSHLYKEKKQSLIVEGGAKTLQSFIDAGLWDEIRIETAPFTVSKGIEAPQLPKNLRITRTEQYVNTIVTYERE